ncbi:hypothetical protein AAA289_27515, partial [Klebsiella variicola]|uniref:hypothetical protein n=1 Tax=Klebsiella variicola TaxID=244366 RepID=UPI0031317B44
CVEQDDKGWDARKRAYCLKIQPATGSFARNLIYSTKPKDECVFLPVVVRAFFISCSQEKGATGERQPLHKGASGMSDQHSPEKAGSPPPPGCYLPLDS